MRPLRSIRAARPCWLGPVCLLVLVLQQFSQQEYLADAIHQSNEQQAANSNEHNSPLQSGPAIMSMGSESSSALESSAALAGDDLIAAESSQSPEKELPASVAPAVFANQQQQQQQPPHFGLHQPQIQARIQHPQQRPFNPFMAAALAGNYGHAQQHIAANAAAAGMHAAGPVHHHPGPQQQQHFVQQQQQQHHAHHPHPQHMGSAHNMGHHQQHQQQSQAQHGHQLINQSPQMFARPAGQQQVQAALPAAAAAAAAEQLAANSMAVQESSLRNNIVPAPTNYNSLIDSNSIELADSPAIQSQQQTSVQPQPQAQQQQQQQQQQQMAVASSVQHPVIASSSQESNSAGAWPLQVPDIPKIVNLEVKCEKNLMKVSIEFDKVFNGVIFSKGHYNQGQCLHVGQNSAKQQAYFDIGINTCGTQGNTQNGLYGMGGNTGSGTFFENTIVIQYDPNVQEVYDHARKLRCTWHDQYEKAVTFRPFPVDMLDIVRADFAGDNVGCWMQIQVGKGPWASEVAGIVKIGQTMTMVLAIKDEENKFDMLVRNCFAHDGKRGPIELVDKSGCITRPKLMSKFTKIKNFGSSATVLSYAHFQAFKFPDSMEVHFQCTIQICRHQCPEQCSASPSAINGGPAGESFSESTISGTLSINGRDQSSAASADSVHLRKYGSPSLSRERRDLSSGGLTRNRLWTNGSQLLSSQSASKPLTQTVGVNRIIQVVSTGDLAFAIQQQQQQQPRVDGFVGGEQQQQLADSTAAQLTRVELAGQVCMSSYNFVLSLVVLSLVLLCSCLAAIFLYLRHKSLMRGPNKLLAPQQQQQQQQHQTATMIRPQQVPTRHQHQPNHRHQASANSLDLHNHQQQHQHHDQMFGSH